MTYQPKIHLRDAAAFQGTRCGLWLAGDSETTDDSSKVTCKRCKALRMPRSPQAIHWAGPQGAPMCSKASERMTHDPAEVTCRACRGLASFPLKRCLGPFKRKTPAP